MPFVCALPQQKKTSSNRNTRAWLQKAESGISVSVDIHRNIRLCASCEWTVVNEQKNGATEQTGRHCLPICECECVCTHIKGDRHGEEMWAKPIVYQLYCTNKHKSWALFILKYGLVRLRIRVFELIGCRICDAINQSCKTLQTSMT